MMKYPKDFPQNSLDMIVAANRFGFGLRPGESHIIARDPRLWLHNQITIYLQNRPKPSSQSAQMMTAAMLAYDQGDTGFSAHIMRMASLVQSNLKDHTEYLLTTDLPFIERWIGFWIEFFGLSTQDQRMFGLKDAIINDVIRPFCFSPYRVLLTQMIKHPAFLAFLGNSERIGPNDGYPIPQQHLLARSILKNFTLGEFGFYHDGDVQTLASMLKPWQVHGPQHQASGSFFYDETMAIPTASRFLNRIFPKAGHLQAEAALEMLTHHPETAQSIATRMARHFVSDSQNTALVGDLIDAYSNSGGSLKAMARGLINSRESWVFRPRKVKTPHDLTLSTLRALGLANRKAAAFAMAGQSAMGQDMNAAPILAQWPAGQSSWLRPDQIEARISWQIEALGWVPDIDFTVEAAFALLGPLIYPSLFRRLLVSASGLERAVLTLTSPAFQWR